MRLVRAALAAAVVLAGLAEGPAGATEVWFGIPQPRADVAERLRPHPGADAPLLTMLDDAQIDWDRLTGPGMLDALAPPMQVAEITTGSLLGTPAADLSDKLGRLVAHGVKLAYVAGPVVIDDPRCGKAEGYESPAILKAAIDKLKVLNLPISYLSMDSGLWSGHFMTDAQGCRLSIDQTVAHVAITVDAFQALYPDIVVGEILPTTPLIHQPGWQDAVRAYRDGLARATGKTLAFFELDIAWEDPSWKQAVVAETVLAHSLRARIGYIYNGDNDDLTDEAWLSHARRNIAEIEGGVGLDPDRASFSTWNPHPAHLLGAPEGRTLASLMQWYAQPGARLRVAAGGPDISGTVTDVAGQPLGGFRVTLDAVPPGAPGAAPPDLGISGTVPDGARTGLVILRVNAECLCAGANDVTIGDAAYTEPAASARRIVSFLPDLRRLAAAGGPAAPSVRTEPGPGGDAARVAAGAGQTVLLNAPPFPVTPGARYSLTVPVANHLGTSMYGAFGIVWLDAHGDGLRRDNLLVRAAYREAASTVTDASGRFAFPRPRDQDGSPAPARLTVPDQQGHRAAIKSLQP